jgi:hypothetical protein
MKLTTEKNKNASLSNSDSRTENFIIDFWLSSVLATIFILLIEKNIWISIVIYYSIRFLYYFSFEYFYQRTPGKFETRTMVINNNGKKPSAIQLIKRNLSRFFSLVSFVSDSEKTIHDEISKTSVIKNINLKKIEFKRASTLLFYLLFLSHWVYNILNKEILKNIDQALLVISLGIIIFIIIKGIKTLNKKNYS